ncbi:Tetratricopeptide-like helical [Artemisia annua]|uniref:Tetratricopeptide-like helical n=1 Tax=Artemisia annua TaxID=35608 RepID=A0A2U1PME4_ARTAN|nr:Tetratricopeptide-like helical [Artemisia annua]
MSGMAGSLPKTGNGSYNTSASGYGNKSQGIGGMAMKSGGIGGGGGGGMGGSQNKDPFGGLVDFSAKGSGGMKTGSKTNVGSKTSVPTVSGVDAFGSFQNAPKSGGNGFTGTGAGTGSQSTFDDFGFGGMGNQASAQSSSMGSGMGSSSTLDDFGFGGMGKQAPVQSSVGNDFDVLFPTSSAGNNASKGSDNFANEQFAGAEDWGFESDIGGGGDVGGTTELEGLPPPPAGVTSSSAKSKGMDNYKAGQYPDAIKWLSWAVILLEKGGDKSGAMEVLSSRASCYKEVGEYKKAVADCSKVLEQDGKNVSVLVQRALLYESMEKYKLGAEDLRTVMNIDPGNRVARSTIHRLTKLAS